MTAAIRVESLGKRYRVAQGGQREKYRTLRESLVESVRAPFRHATNGTATAEDFWALQDVSFEVQPGEVVGIIGRNGAGKSTLLKILSRITKPTKGRVEINGRVGSLLEVGTGFHPELTGRENIYLNGSILGMSRKEIDRKFDEIVAFAEVEKFLDTPVKRYSSGMYVRLAFAVAAHLEPEILIVDEVLAVGDAGFQQKCLGKMREVGKAGRTVLFVSHNLNAVATLTNKSILLKNGEMVGCDNTPSILDQYLEIGGETKAVWLRVEGDCRPAATICAVRSRNVTGGIASRFAADEPFFIEFECEFRIAAEAQLAFRLNSDRECETVFTSSLTDQDNQRSRRFPIGRFVARCPVPCHLLRPGFYHVLVALNNPRGPQFDMVERVLSFEISEVGSLARFDGRLGSILPLLKWDILSHSARA
jgi:lipopolysaccharide transport system ATP-binding protein